MRHMHAGQPSVRLTQAGGYCLPNRHIISIVPPDTTCVTALYEGSALFAEYHSQSLRLGEKDKDAAHRHLIHDDLARGPDGKLRNLIPVDIPRRGDRVAERRPLMRIGIIKGRQMAPILPVKQKHLPLHMVLVHRLKGSANEQ